MITHCIHCGRRIDTSLGKYSPVEAPFSSKGLAPGDYENVCAPCNYGRGLRGYPMQKGSENDR